jgi:hypothetical protein
MGISSMGSVRPARVARGLSALLVGALVLAAAVRQAEADEADGGGIGLFDVHRTLGTVSLGAFASALVISAASGNLGALMDARRCCPGGGERREPWRAIDRGLVTTGIVAYSGAAVLAGYNLLVANRPSAERPRVGHQAHRWLALGHGTVFLTSAVTGLIMFLSQESNPERFASAARVHTAANVILVPLLTAAMSNILFE